MLDQVAFHRIATAIRVLGRSAAAYRNRPGASDGTKGNYLRRTSLSARRLGPSTIINLLEDVQKMTGPPSCL